MEITTPTTPTATFETLLDLFYGDPNDAEEFEAVADDAPSFDDDEHAYWGAICAAAVEDDLRGVIRHGDRSDPVQSAATDELHRRAHRRP